MDKKITWQSYTVHDDKQISGFFGEYRWLSNFEECLVWYEGMQFPSSEAAYQAAKTTNPDLRKRFSLLPPRQAKDEGQLLDLRPNWEKMKVQVMYDILTTKFNCNKELFEKLMATGDRWLTETNHWGDKFWGKDYATGDGGNQLGLLLMRIRNNHL